MPDIMKYFGVVDVDVKVVLIIISQLHFSKEKAKIICVMIIIPEDLP